MIRALIKPLTKGFAGLPATELGPKKLKLLQQDMIALGWTRRSINRAQRSSSGVSLGVRLEELIPASIPMGLKTVRGLQKNRTAAKEKPPIGPVDDVHVDAVLGEVSPLVADVIRFMQRTGCRPGEALGLTESQLDRTDPSCCALSLGAAQRPSIMARAEPSSSANAPRSHRAETHAGRWCSGVRDHASGPPSLGLSCVQADRNSTLASQPDPAHVRHRSKAQARA